MKDDMSRRGFLAANGALLAGITLPSSAAATLFQARPTWEPIPPVDLGELSPDDFGDEELEPIDIPYLLAHFHQLANSVVESGDNRGFISLPVYQSPEETVPENIRIMENIVSLAYFYVTNRTWNPYRHLKPLRQRLEAALDFYVRIQDENGMFPAPGGTDFGGPYMSLAYARTAFATKFMGQTLNLLNGDETLDETVYEDAMSAQRRSLHYLLTETGWYEFVRRFSNQYSNVFAGGLAFLELREDSEIEDAVLQRMSDYTELFQSPAGYFYENHGPDWGYGFGTHYGNVRQTRHYALLRSDAEVYLEILANELSKWTEWLSHNAVIEPGDVGFVLNRAIETRQRRWFFERNGAAFAREVPLHRAFAASESEVEAQRQQTRDLVNETWPEVAPLESYSPYGVLGRDHARWVPSDDQRASAVASLPYHERDRYTHVRADSRVPRVFSFVRRPTYYAAFNSGNVVSAQRLGLGLLWNPEWGAVLQSQTGEISSGVWGTRAGAPVARFRFDVPTTGRYAVESWWFAHRSRATNTPYLIRHAGGETVVRVDQQADGSRWNPLGVFEFNEGGDHYIEVRNDEANGVVVADAVRLGPGDTGLPTLVVDDLSPGFELISGSWLTSTGSQRYEGHHHFAQPDELPYEAGNLLASLFVDGVEFVPEPGASDAPDGTFVVTYGIGESGTKTVTFDSEWIEVTTEHSGTFHEDLPLLRYESDVLDLATDRITMSRQDSGGATLQLSLDLNGATAVESITSSTEIGMKQLVTIRITAQETLTYRVSFH